MPWAGIERALVAVQRDPYLKAFYELLQSRHKAKLQALIAAARKLLHAIYGIFRSLTPYDGSKLFPAIIPEEQREISPLNTPKEKNACNARENLGDDETVANHKCVSRHRPGVR